MLVLPARLTAHDARDALRMLSQALRREPEGSVIVDACALSQLDSSALAVLLECQRLSQAFGRAFVLRNVPLKLAQLARLYGVDSLLNIEPATQAHT